MGWRGTLRTMGAMARQAERDAERRRKHQTQQLIANASQNAVEEWRQRLEDLVSLHVAPTDQMNWTAIAQLPEPQAPNRKSVNESEALFKRDRFQPKFWHAIVGGSQKRLGLLEAHVDEARSKDEMIFDAEIVQYQTAHTEWVEDVRLAKRLLDGEVEAQHEVISEFKEWTDDGLLGTRINFLISRESLHAIIHVHDDQVVPKTRLKQLKSGGLSESKMHAGDINELYQDYVCSAALKVAGDLFAMLPRSEIYVTCVVKMLNSATGCLEDMPILSVRFIGDTFTGLRLGHIDPSDSMRNFSHEMKFKRTAGFSPITPLLPIK